MKAVIMAGGKGTGLELAVMAASGEAIYAYKSPEYVKDVGTVDRIEKAVSELDAGLISRKNLSNKQSAIFLDRDGTINKYPCFELQ